MYERECRDYLEMSIHALFAFARFGRMDARAFDHIVDIALRDNRVDDNEKRVLNNIIDSLRPHELTDELTQRITHLRVNHGV